MIKLLQPKMPTADQLLPYLRRIDEARWYSNFGPLVMRLEDRLSLHYDNAHIVTVSNCTAGLEIVYREFTHMELGSWSPKLLLPALTFPATILAAHTAGFGVDFCDVDPKTWTAWPVSGFGLPEIGSPLDAAGAYGEQTVRVGQTAVFSLHATKILGCGEGGYIVTHDAELARRYRRMTNFGMESGISKGWGTNAKMSEYHAAVALASLDLFDREPWLQLFDWYDEHLPDFVVKQKRPRGVYPMLSVKLPCPAKPVMEIMRQMGVETRQWYCPPMYRHPLFEAPPLPVTEDLAEHLIGLPWHLYLTEADVVQVCRMLRQSVAQAIRL